MPSNTGVSPATTRTCNSASMSAVDGSAAHLDVEGHAGLVRDLEVAGRHVVVRGREVRRRQERSDRGDAELAGRERGEDHVGAEGAGAGWDAAGQHQGRGGCEAEDEPQHSQRDVPVALHPIPLPRKAGDGSGRRAPAPIDRRSYWLRASHVKSWAPVVRATAPPFAAALFCSVSVNR